MNATTSRSTKQWTLTDFFPELSEKEIYIASGVCASAVRDSSTGRERRRWSIFLSINWPGPLLRRSIGGLCLCGLLAWRCRQWRAYLAAPGDTLYGIRKVDPCLFSRHCALLRQLPRHRTLRSSQPFGRWMVFEVGGLTVLLNSVPWRDRVTKPSRRYFDL